MNAIAVEIAAIPEPVITAHCRGLLEAIKQSLKRGTLKNTVARRAKHHTKRK